METQAFGALPDQAALPQLACPRRAWGKTFHSLTKTPLVPPAP